MKKLDFIFVMIFFLMALICPQWIQAGDIYTYTDKDGNTIISNTPIPEKHESKAKKIESYKRDSPEEIQRYQAEQKAKEQTREAETRQKHQINQAQKDAQKQNDRQQAQQKQPQEQQQKDEEKLNCWTFQPPGSPYTWEHCRDKNGKITKRRI
jgi:Skp family chaperone for outer membrane proteins